MNSAQKILLGICLCLLYAGRVDAQTPNADKKPVADSPRKTFMERMGEFSRKYAQMSKDDFQADKASLMQDHALEEIRKKAQQAKIYLRSGIDTSGIITDLARIDSIFMIASEGVFTSTGTSLSFRNIQSSTIIIDEMLDQAQIRKVQLDTYHQRLSGFKYEIDSLLSLPELFRFPKDSVAVRRYIDQLSLINYDLSPVDSALGKANRRVRDLLINLNKRVYRLQGASEELHAAERRIASAGYRKDSEYLWQISDKAGRFPKSLSDSARKASLTLLYYTRNNLSRLAVLSFVFMAVFSYLRSLKISYRASVPEDNAQEERLILKNVLLAALAITAGCIQFIFVSPPFVYNIFFWLVPAVCVSLLIRGFIRPYWMRVWLSMLILFTLAGACNLILTPSLPERIIMLLIAATAVILGLLVWFSGKRDELRENWIIYSIGLMAVLEFLSIVCNVTGRYNLAKSFMVGGLANVVVAIQFLWIVRFINEGLLLSFTMYDRQATRLFYVNHGLVGKKAPPLLYIALVVGWIVLFGKNFPAFSYVSEPIRQFFIAEREVGSYTFSVANILLFLGILAGATLLSKVVSYFASDQHLVSEKSTDKSQKLGSWLLLIRIAILTCGILLAFRAVGFDLDKLTLIIGALGVGIGLGLQTLVNNLVSGLIIAFEKPVNVGDVIDLDGQSGKMKSIGFRSSVIATVDGAHVIVPNGDILNAHLTNWSSAGNRKRMLIKVGISYASNLGRAQQLTRELLDNHEKVSKNPAPNIYFEQLGSSAVELSIYFWTKHMTEALLVKSELIVAIEQAYRENNIEIPFPQQEIHLHKSPDEP